MTGRAARRYGDIQRVYEYISAHLRDNLSVTELAETFYMDKNTLTRQFRQVTGMTPAECVRRMRLDAAYTMISHGASASGACHECGFSDYSAFYRAFRQAFGISPSACASLPESGVRLHRET
jgi:AraC-like DNA-binding protein